MSLSDEEISRPIGDGHAEVPYGKHVSDIVTAQGESFDAMIVDRGPERPLCKLDPE
jgi:hypothetical protein